MISGYSSPFNVGHKALENFWNGAIWIEEKIDGSQFSFSMSKDGFLYARAHKQDLTPFCMNPELGGMFTKALQTVLDIKDLLVPGWTYRGEFIGKPKQNTLCYERVPKQFIILFDIDKGDQDYLNPFEAQNIADGIGLEFVPVLTNPFETTGDKLSLDSLLPLLETDSILGGTKVEGIVLKNYTQWGMDDKTLMAKLVSKDFREKHDVDWRLRNPKVGTIVERIVSTYSTEARWMKAVQHLREQDKLIGAPQDIGLLIHEIPADIFKDAEAEIRDVLFEHFKRDIERGVVKGFPEFYKRLLAEEFFK
jgi:hypothetical protein